jgi:Arc/MetJ-type ribon-helix-helix transcriptional regulator
MLMTVVSVRIPERLKKRMDEAPWINWSEILRQAIVDTLEREEGRRLAEAVMCSERLRRDAPEGWDSTEFIRRDRMRDARERAVRS